MLFRQLRQFRRYFRQFYGTLGLSMGKVPPEATTQQPAYSVGLLLFYPGKHVKSLIDGLTSGENGIALTPPTLTNKSQVSAHAN